MRFICGCGWDGEGIGDGDGARRSGEICKTDDDDEDGIHSPCPQPRFRTDIQNNADPGETWEGTSILNLQHVILSGSR